MLDFLKKPNENKENFWALLIEPEWINSAIWQINDGKVDVICTSPETRWEETADDTGAGLIEAIDTSLSACSQSLPEDAPDPTKTVFGVPNSWLENGNIKEEYLAKLKKICDDLSLTPSGFVVISEAISHYIKNDEEAPLTGMILGVSSENLELSIFNSGKLTGTTNIARSLEVGDDLTEGLSRLGGSMDNFPPRVVLFNQKEQELTEILENLNNYDWEKLEGTSFMHTPKVEIFDPSKKIFAIALAGGSELGAVAGIGASKTFEEGIVEEDTKTEELPLEEVVNVEEPEGVTAADLGFVQETSEVASDPTPIPVHMPELPKLPKLNFNFNFKKPNIKFPKMNLALSGKPLVIGGTALATFIVVGFVLWWFLPKASVTIYVAPKKLEENIELNLDSGLTSKTVDASVTGEKSKSTTGTKTVGEKAKGAVKIQNGTAFPINLPAGSTLVSSGDLKFLTTESASVSGALSPSTPGTATINIEASSIGSEYNLAKDEVFKVANYPKAEVDGTATDTFSGGSSKQISAVSEDDRKSLLNDLTKELLEEAKTKLSGSIPSEDFLIDSSLTSETEEEDFSNKVGDEATTIKLSLALKVTGTTVSKNDLTNTSKEALKDKVPSGFVLRDDQLIYDFSSDDDDNFTVRVTANLLPNINPDEIAKKITGKYPGLAEAYLASVPGFVRAEFRLKPLLPGKLGTLPHVSKNISVEFSADK